MVRQVGSPVACIENGYDAGWCHANCTEIDVDTVRKGDSLKLLKCLKSASVDLIFADEPYNIAGQTVIPVEWKDKKWRAINREDQPWDAFATLDTFDQFHRAWLSEAKRVLKPGGALWVSGTYHNIYRLGREIVDQGFTVLNDITWYKRNAFPNVRGSRFTASHETLIWATKKVKGHPYTFHYDLMKGGEFPEDNLKRDGKQMRSVWDIPTAGHESVGYPTQKPTKLLERVILASSNPGDVVLDPFLGSGTSAAVAKNHCRHFVGFDMNPVAITKSTQRLKEVTPACQLP